MQMKANIYTMMKQIHTKMTSNKMKEWMKTSVVKKSEEYAGIHKNNNENEPDDINENKLDENTVSYVSDTKVSTEGSYLRLSSRALIMVERLEPKLKGQSHKNALPHKVKKIYENIEL